MVNPHLSARISPKWMKWMDEERGEMSQGKFLEKIFTEYNMLFEKKIERSVNEAIEAIEKGTEMLNVALPELQKLRKRRQPTLLFDRKEWREISRLLFKIDEYARMLQKYREAHGRLPEDKLSTMTAYEYGKKP